MDNEKLAIFTANNTGANTVKVYNPLIKPLQFIIGLLGFCYLELLTCQLLNSINFSLLLIGNCYNCTLRRVFSRLYSHKSV